jgi:hypothetical protein
MSWKPDRHVHRVRHARSDELEPLLVELRRVPGLVERKRGIFYRKSQAFLHFHEDVSGLPADVHLAEAFERIRVEAATKVRSFSIVCARRSRRADLAAGGCDRDRRRHLPCGVREPALAFRLKRGIRRLVRTHTRRDRDASEPRHAGAASSMSATRCRGGLPPRPTLLPRQRHRVDDHLVATVAVVATGSGFVGGRNRRCVGCSVPSKTLNSSPKQVVCSSKVMGRSMQFASRRR